MKTGFIVFFALSAASAWGAETAITTASASVGSTIVQKRINATERFIPLKKLTIGPDDQYHGVMDPSGERVIFTHKADLVSHLKIQSLKTGIANDLLELNADSQEPAVSPLGQVAFTYYKYNARGDICYFDLPAEVTHPVAESQIKCLKREGQETTRERSNPFWKNAQQIGYVVRDIQNRVWRIVFENIKTGVTEVIAEGKVWSPSMIFNGTYIVYDEISSQTAAQTSAVMGSAAGASLKRSLVIQNLITGKKNRIHLAIPGITGFPGISDDERYLYFSHYMNDTNDDNLIDGSDNAVVFRLPIQALINLRPDEEIFPEQLSSVESSCSYPRPSKEGVLVTCAFEGNLDIYQIPLTGTVPTRWDEALLKNALQTSRSYQDRILVLNTLKFRKSASKGAAAQAPLILEQMLLNNHILADDASAARYYLDKLAVQDPQQKTFYHLLKIYLEARELKRAQPSDEVNREFRAQIETLVKKLATVPVSGADQNFSNIVHGLMYLLINDKSHAAGFASRARLAGVRVRPLERVFYFELEMGLNRSNSAVFSQMIKAPELSEEAKLFYTFNYLKWAENAFPLQAARIKALEQFNRGFPAPAEALIKSEVSTLKLIQAETSKKDTFYRELDRAMSESRNDYFLRKALYVRAILNFTAHGEFKYLSLIATNWLRYTTAGDTEFIYAREVFSASALDQAYDALGSKKLDYAGNFFYESLSLTDDLESHAGYINTMIAKQQRPTIDVRYKNLRDRSFISDNYKFVEALLAVKDAPLEPKSLDTAISKLETMEQDRDSAVRYLFLGAAHLKKLLNVQQIKGQPAELDANLFQSAHRELMLAYDLGRDNARVKASALMNLGILHQHAANYGLSVRFLTLRKSLGFLDPIEKSKFEWIFAESLFHHYQESEAAKELDEVTGVENTSAVMERKAFYWMSAGKFLESSKIYQNLLDSGQIKGDLNLAKAHLNLGYNQWKLNPQSGKSPAALKSLTQARAAAFKVEPLPVAIVLIIEGLIAQASADEGRVQALERRISLLKSQEGKIDEWLPTLIKARQQLAKAYGSNPKASEQMNEVLSLTEKYGNENQYFGSPVFHALTGYMIHALTHPALYAPTDVLPALYAKTIKAYENQKVEDPVLDFQKMKLKILWGAYAKKIANGSPLEPVDFNSAEALRIKTSLPKQWGELQQLVKKISY